MLESPAHFDLFGDAISEASGPVLEKPGVLSSSSCSLPVLEVEFPRPLGCQE